VVLGLFQKGTQWGVEKGGSKKKYSELKEVRKGRPKRRENNSEGAGHSIQQEK